MARPSSARGKSPNPAATPAAATKKAAAVTKSYKSDGVDDNDVFLLPGADYLVMLGLTVLATAVRIFRISQPTSVVFDEVQ